MMRIRAILACLAVLVVVPPASASAALPKPKTTLIVPNKSIAGVALGAKASQVTSAWGENSQCALDCAYEASPKGNETPSGASVLLEEKSSGAQATAWLISLHVGFKSVNGDSVPSFKSSLTQFKTPKGIGLGSKASELAKAYPKAKKKVIAGSGYYYEIAGPKEVATTFTFSDDNRIVGLAVESHPGG
jgi:hypothetical protein